MKKRIKNKLIKGLAISMAFSILICNSVFATPIDLVDSTKNIQTDTLDRTEGTDYFEDETTNEWLNGEINEEVRVTVDLASQFTITIPKEIVLDGETGKADYVVNAKGDIAGDQILSIIPDEEFSLKENGGKDDIIAIITQENTDYTYQDLLNDGTDYSGSIEATLSAGEWAGKFNFNINFFENEDIANNSKLPKKESFETMSIENLKIVVEKGLAQEYFSIGDIRNIKVGGTSYRFKILGFNNFDLADGSGKANMYLGMIDNYHTRYRMSSENTNAGGYPSSPLRKTVSNLSSSFEEGIREIMKTVKVYCDYGENTDYYDNSVKYGYINEKVFLPSRGVDLPTGDTDFVWTRSSTAPSNINNAYYVLPDNGQNLTYRGCTMYCSIKLTFCI